MDVFLDSLGWSGCNSSFESLTYNLPIVTLPEKPMRSRHTAAILTMMGMSDYIANSLDDFLARAIQFGNNTNKRNEMSERIAAQKNSVYCDETAILGLEEFLKNASGKH